MFKIIEEVNKYSDEIESDPIKPDHYGGENNPHEAIKIIEAMGWGYEFCMGNVIKYSVRAGKKQGESKEQDEAKSNWYLNRANEIKSKLKEK